MTTSTGCHKRPCTTVNPWLYQTQNMLEILSIPTQHNLYNNNQLPLQLRCNDLEIYNKRHQLVQTNKYYSYIFLC